MWTNPQGERGFPAELIHFNHLYPHLRSTILSLLFTPEGTRPQVHAQRLIFPRLIPGIRRVLQYFQEFIHSHTSVTNDFTQCSFWDGLRSEERRVGKEGRC